MASYIFNLFSSDAEQSQNGWYKRSQVTEATIKDIPDTLSNIGNLSKVGTSIPTPLARIYLFNAAFEFMASHVSARNEVYQGLVNDALDLLQMIFENGVDEDSSQTSKLKVLAWKGASVIRSLKNSGSEEKRLLGKSLELAFGSGSEFGQDQQINLIYFDGMLLGGTSPFNLVYTGANLRDEVEAERQKDGRADYLTSNFRIDRKVYRFFDAAGKYVPLRSRPADFKEYLYGIYRTAPEEVTGMRSPLYSFFQYVRQECGDVDFAEAGFEKNFHPVRNLEVPVQTKDGNRAKIVLRFNAKRPPIAEKSYFTIHPDMDVCGKDVLPLVLPSRDTVTTGINHWAYISEDEPWSMDTVITEMYLMTNPDPMKRSLPQNGAAGEMTNIKYPWLTDMDLFEDTLVDLGFTVDGNRFVIPQGEDNFRFLLPVKKAFFDYFKPETLRKNLSVRYTDSNRSGIPTAVVFTLTIPLKADRALTFQRKYQRPRPEDRSKDNFGLPKGVYPIRYFESGLDVGIFPFYQLNEKNPVGDYYTNAYSVYLFSHVGETEKKEASLSFYFQSDEEGKKGLFPVNVPEFSRTVTNGQGISKVYNLENRNEFNSYACNKFSLLSVDIPRSEVSTREDHGLVIPVWMKALPQVLRQKPTVLSVDFGTSNTHVAYLDTSDGRSESVVPFSIPDQERQFVFLNKRDASDPDYRHRESFGDVGAELQSFWKETVPSVIGLSANREDRSSVKYPIKTATLESAKFRNATGSRNLFETINIGYDIDNEFTRLDTQLFNYQEDLKWQAMKHRSDGNNSETQLDEARIRAFCKQTLWMLKNMVIIKNIGLEGNRFVYFYPGSMSVTDQRSFQQIWKEESEEVWTKFNFKLTVEPPIMEAIAPYYSLIALPGVGQQIFTRNSVNIDIGGGTTDIFVLDKGSLGFQETGRAFESSILFAGNQLWGIEDDARSLEERRRSKNGFVSYMMNLIQSGNYHFKDGELKRVYETNYKDKPADQLVSFFFKYNEFNFGGNVKMNQNLRFVMFLHYSSIVYYLADFLKYIRFRNDNFRMPEILTFTGKGSEYIKLLGDEAEIARLTSEMLKAFGIEIRQFSVYFPANPKELTANGGIYSMNPDCQITLKAVDEDDFDVSIGALSDLGNTSTVQREKYIHYDYSQDILGYKKDVVDEKAGSLLNEQVRNDATRAMVMEKVKDYVSSLFRARNSSKILKEYMTGIIGNPDDANAFASENDMTRILRFAEESFDTQKQLFNNRHQVDRNEDAKENLFFLAMRNLFIKLSNFYVK